jgi:galactofuranosylgalactofuranosylrhamnosyl-N-acetylglucosaminyl-diphospho-decaprenol beta-1,5/1,6-galactofuranosyltransferase
MRYSTAALRLRAIEDVLSGPAHLHRELLIKPQELRELRAGYIEARYEPDLECFPPVRRRPPADIESNAPASRKDILRMAVAGTAHQFRRPRRGARQRPQMALPIADAHWWLLAKLDSALVSAPDGASVSWHQRDRAKFRKLGIRSFILHRRVRRRWPRLAAQYRGAAAECTSPEQWRQTYHALASQPPAQR